MITASLVFVLWGVAAAWLERLRPVHDPVARAVCWSAVGCAIACSTMQLLSLGGWLSHAGVAATAASFALLAWSFAGRPRPADELRAAFNFTRSIRARAAGDGATLEATAPWLLAAASLLALGLLAQLNHPTNDIYHLTMPFYWVQHASIAPFDAPNARVTAFAFATHALRVPFLMYAGVDRAHLLLCLAAAVGLIAVMHGLARQLGASAPTAATTAVAALAYTPLPLAVVHGALESLLGALWFAAALLVVLQLPRASAETTTAAMLRPIAWSAFLCGMGVGAKNLFALLVPLYAIVLAVVLGRRLFAHRLLAAAVGAFGIGLLASGVVWNYAANQLFYADWRGPATISSHMATFGVSAIWTRLCRGLTILLDPTWLPAPLAQRLLEVVRGIPGALGAAAHLPEDAGFYAFPPERLPMRRGLGPLGLLLFVPSLAAAFAFARSRRATEGKTATAARNAVVLAAVTLLGFVLYHGVARWQSIGLVHLMLPLVVVGAPLGARLLGHRSARAAALVLCALHLAVLGVLYHGLAARKHGWTDPVSLWLRGLQHDHEASVQIRTADGSARELVVRESYSKRELYQALIPRIPSPATIGFIGGPNAEEYFAAGPRHDNHIVPLVGARDSPRLTLPSSRLDFVIVEGAAPGVAERLARLVELEPIFDASDSDESLLSAYRVPETQRPARSAASSAGSASAPH